MIVSLVACWCSSFSLECLDRQKYMCTKYLWKTGGLCAFCTGAGVKYGSKTIGSSDIPPLYVCACVCGCMCTLPLPIFVCVCSYNMYVHLCMCVCRLKQLRLVCFCGWVFVCVSLTIVTVKIIRARAAVALTCLTSWKRMRRSCTLRCSWMKDADATHTTHPRCTSCEPECHDPQNL